MSLAFSPTTLGPIELRNRVLKCGTNEGMSRDGLVTDALVDWHREFAAGGVAMTTLAYCAVSPEGRTFRHQVHLRDEARPGLERFAREMNDAGARAAIQIGHAGWFANPAAMKQKSRPRRAAGYLNHLHLPGEEPRGSRYPRCSAPPEPPSPAGVRLCR